MAAPDFLDRLYDAQAPALYAFVLNLTRHEEDTRDLLQDIFLKMAREPSLLAGVRNERAFLLRMARNAVVDLALILHVSTPQPHRTAPASATASPPSVRMTFAEQRAWLDLVLQPASAPPATLRLVPGPRSDRFAKPVNA